MQQRFAMAVARWMGTGAALAVLIAATPALAADGWQHFTGPGGAFTVDMPGRPIVTKKTKDTPNGAIPETIYHVDDNVSSVMVMDMDLTGSRITIDLHRIAQGLAGNGRIIVQTKPLTRDGYPGIFHVVTATDGNLMTDTAFVVDHHYYQVITVVPSHPAPALAARAARFTQSFHLPPGQH